MTLVREPGSEILTQFGVPTRGTWRNTAINTIPLDAVYDSLNVFIREGKLRTRPGLSLVISAFPYDPSFSRNILGGAMIVTANDEIVLAASRNRLFFISGNGSGLWEQIPDGAPFLATADTDVIDMAFLETSATTVALFAHSSRVIKHWKPGDVAVTSIPGGVNIPLAKSICISSSRVIALIQPHTVVWSRVLNYANFDALAVVKRAQTPDRGICVRSLSALSFVLYKENSIHTARAQAGLDEGSAFAFAEPIVVEGPAGIYAVVEVEGRHIYMTKSGRIAIFDGTNYPTWIADGMWFYLQNDINQAHAYRIRGVYDYRLNIVVFFYPRFNELFGMTGMVIVNLPFPGFEQQDGLRPYAFLGQASVPVLHVCTKRFNDDINRGLIIGPEPVSISTSVTHYLDEEVNQDANIDFTSSFQTGLQSVPDARHIKITVESFFERSFGYGTVSVEPITSHSLEIPGGTRNLTAVQTINLANTPVNEYMGFNLNTRFFGLRYSWDSNSKVRYSGSVVYTSLTNRLKG
jgi:hypothetical protein